MRGWKPLKQVEVTIYLNKEQKPYGTLSRTLYQHSHSPSYFVINYHKQYHPAKYTPQKGWHINA